MDVSVEPGADTDNTPEIKQECPSSALEVKQEEFGENFVNVESHIDIDDSSEIEQNDPLLQFVHLQERLEQQMHEEPFQNGSNDSRNNFLNVNSVSSLQNKRFSQLSDEEKLIIKKLGRPLPDITISQKLNSRKSKYTRTFRKYMYNNHDWLCGCDIKNALFCFPCLLFGGDTTWTNSGVTDLNHLSSYAKRHESSASHLECVLKLTLFGQINIASQLDSAHKKKNAEENAKQNRYLLNTLINCIRFCGIFDLALKDHDAHGLSSNLGIFRGLINFSSELDTALKSHLERTALSKETLEAIQNELLQVMLEVCQEEIVNQIKEADYLTIIVDETSDLSDVFQMVIVYRYVMKGKPVERFWSFISPPQQDAKTLASCVLGELQKLNLDVSKNAWKLIAQTYDGASLLSGSSGGVQTLIKEKFPHAEYIHCYAHQVNLVMGKTSSVNRNVRIFFANLQGICKFFSVSPQRTAVLNSVVRKRLPHASDIWWNFLSKSVNTIFNHKEDIIECMDVILREDKIKSENTIYQAFSLQKILASDDFNFWLSFFSKIMPLVDRSFSQPQKEINSTDSAKMVVSEFETNVKHIRNQIDLDWGKTTESVHNSSRKRKQNNPEWNREAKEICDVIISEAKARFTFLGHLVASTLLIPILFRRYSFNFPEEIVREVCSTYNFFDKSKLSHELRIIYSTKEFWPITGAVDLLNFFVENSIEKTFSETSKLLKLVLTIPMASSETERCFLTLKRIKTFLSNSMPEERLSALAMLSIEKDLVMEISDFNQRVVDKFIASRNRRMEILFK